MKTRLLAICFIFFTLFTSGKLFAQATKEVTHQYQTWLGYMSSTQISEKWSLWNDAHWVFNHGFFIVRTGLTYNFPKTAITGGYAYARLPISGQDGLPRQEHRPWAQIVFTVPLSHDWSLTERVRYDARFRQDVVNGKTTDTYSFVNRIRFQINLRKSIPQWKFDGNEPFVALADEVLLNFGKEIVYNTFDQNRLSLMVGLKRKNIQYMTGYMSRFVQHSSGNSYTQNNTWVVWVVQKFSFRKKKPNDQMDMPGAD
jgi:hypothetical protein